MPVFVDNFTSINDFSDSVWKKNNIGGQIIKNDGLTLISGINEYFPYIISKINIFPTTGDFYTKVVFKYLETTDRGVGFGFGNIDPGYSITSWTNIADSDLVKFQVWQGLNDNMHIETRKCSSANNCESSRTNVYLANPDTNQHTIYLKNINGVTNFYFDGIKTDSSPINNTFWRPSFFWIGNPSIQSLGNWTDLKILKVEVGRLENSPYVLKIILIPGLGASWDIGSILTGNDGGNWQIPSFVKTYGGLRSSLVNALGEDNVFVFSYDWRKPLSTLSERLNQFIIKNIPAGERVNLIGHSMGGLIARSYAQGVEGTSRVNKILTIGSPNMGTAKAYGVWEGGLLFEDSWWAKLALEMTTHFGVIIGESNIQTIQRMVPSLKDLLPTYDFLSLNGNILPWSSLSENGKNTFLYNLNQNISQIDPITTAIYSNDNQTNSIIKITPHIDGDLGTWIDGKPTDDPFINEAGDGTVTSLSARGAFSNNIQGVGWHGELVTKNENIQKIFSELNLIDLTKIVEGTYDSNNNVLVAVLKSPGKLEVCNFELTKCNSELGGIYILEHKLFIMPGYTGEKLIIRIKEDGTGTYFLHLGNISDSSKWDVEQGNIQAGQVDYYNIEINPQNVTLVLDKEGPSVPQITGFQNPQIYCGGTTNQQSITIDWEDSVDKNGVAGYECSIDNSNSQFISDSEYSVFLSDEGVHGFKIRAKDKFENYSEWSSGCSITVDRTPPVVVITSPSAGSYLPKTLPKLVYNTFDNLDLEPSVNIGDMPKNEGTHIVTVTATDDAGNVGKDSVSYTIQLPPENKNLCKNFGWKTYSLTGFKNQGACVSFVESNEKAINRIFWWI